MGLTNKKILGLLWQLTTDEIQPKKLGLIFKEIAEIVDFDETNLIIKIQAKHCLSMLKMSFPKLRIAFKEVLGEDVTIMLYPINKLVQAAERFNRSE